MSGNTSALDIILDSLVHLIAGADDRTNTIMPKSSIQHYDGFDIIDDRLGRGDDILLSDNPSDLAFWPMDARAAVWKGDGWLFKRIRTLNPKDWRGKLRVVMPKMIEVSEAYVLDDARMYSALSPYGISGGKLVDALNHNHPLAGMMVHIGDIYTDAIRSDNGTLSYPTMDLRVGQGFEIRREYLWSVLIGEAGIPRARFVTDPVGVRAAFRLRDIPPGKERRAALRHWVASHWRQKRDASAADRAFVREYMRGAKSFQWNGLGCTIEPSREDVRRANREAKP